MIRVFSMVFAMLALASTAAAQIYVQGSYAGTEAGTASQPFNTLSEAQSAATAGSTIFLYPEVYRDVLGSGRGWSSTSKNNITIRAWPGVTGTTPAPVITGAIGVASASLTNVATDVWSFSVSDATKVMGVTYAYYTTTKASSPCQGSYGGWLTEIRTATPATDLTTVNSTPNSWALSATSGAATVRVNIAGTGSTPPPDNLIEWVFGTANGNAMVFASSDGITVDGINFDRINARYSDGANGAAISIQTSTGSKVTNCTFADCDDKAVGFTGTVNTNNTVSNCTFRGVAPQQPDSQLNWFVSGTATITGARATNCTFFMHGLYTRSHTPLPPRPTTVSGWGSGYAGSGNPVSSHVAAAGTQFVGDVQLTRCTFESDPACFLGTASAVYPSAPTPMYCNGSKGVAGDLMLVANYPVRVVQCTFSKWGRIAHGQYESIAYDRCSILLNGDHVTDVFRDNTGDRGVIGFSTGATDARLLFSGCYVYNTGRATGTNTSAFLSFGNATSATANNLMLGVKSTFVDGAVPSASTQATIMINAMGTATNQSSKMRFTKCAFIGATDNNGTLTGTLSGAASSFARRFLFMSSFDHARAQIVSQAEFAECFYVGMPTTGTSVGGFAGSTGGSAVNDATEWCSGTSGTGIDAAGVTATAPLLVSLLTGEPTAASALRTARTKSYEAVLGINNRPGTNIGAWQYGAVTPTPY